MSCEDAIREAIEYCFDNWPECQVCGSPFWWVREKNAQDVYHCHFCPDSKIRRDPETGTWSYVTIVETSPVLALDAEIQACAVKVAQRMVEDLEAKLMACLVGPGAVNL